MAEVITKLVRWEQAGFGNVIVVQRQALKSLEHEGKEQSGNR